MAALKIFKRAGSLCMQSSQQEDTLHYPFRLELHSFPNGMFFALSLSESLTDTCPFLPLKRVMLISQVKRSQVNTWVHTLTSTLHIFHFFTYWCTHIAEASPSKNDTWLCRLQ